MCFFWSSITKTSKFLVFFQEKPFRNPLFSPESTTLEHYPCLAGFTRTVSWSLDKIKEHTDKSWFLVFDLAFKSRLLMTWIDRHEKQFCLFCKFCFILYIIWFTMNFGVKSDAGKNKKGKRARCGNKDKFVVPYYCPIQWEISPFVNRV